MSTHKKHFLGSLAGVPALLWLALSPIVARRIYRLSIFGKYRPGSLDVLRSMKDLSNREVSITTSGGKKLRGWFFHQPDATRVLLYFAGRGSDIASRVDHCRLLASCGVSVLVFEYRGFGPSKERATVARMLEDSVAAFDFLVRQEGWNPGDIVLYGESLGSGAACHVASVRDAGALILQAGYSSLVSLMREIVPFLWMYPKWVYPRTDRLDNTGIIRRLSIPFFAVHGARDDIIDPHHARDNFENAPEPKKLVVLPNSTHRVPEPADTDVFKQNMVDFLASL